MTFPTTKAVRWSALVVSAVVGASIAPGASMALAAPVATTPSRGVESTVTWEKPEGGKDYSSMAPAAPVATSPSRGVESTVIWEKTEGGKDYSFRRVVIAPGGSTGWHSHPGQLAGTFKEGTLIHNRAADCSVDGLYTAGQGILELGGLEEVHIGRNNGSVPVVVEMLYINPAGAPLSVPAPDPGCGFD